jgi:hypothetical protein
MSKDFSQPFTVTTAYGKVFKFQNFSEASAIMGMHRSKIKNALKCNGPSYCCFWEYQTKKDSIQLIKSNLCERKN